jgi:hypothetical protein
MQSGAIPAVWNVSSRNSGEAGKFRVTITTEKINLTGILLVKYVDGAWRGSLINEFGIKAFDFISSPGKCRLLNLAPFLQKWYVKNTLAEDIRFMFEADNPGYVTGRRSERTVGDGFLSVVYKGKKEIRKYSDGSLTLQNRKRNIFYSLKPVRVNDE